MFRRVRHLYFSNRIRPQLSILFRQNILIAATHLIRPTVVYSCETWVLKESIIRKLSVFERKMLRKIFGPTKEANGIWRIKTNKELDELIKHRNIINYVKAQRLS